MTAPLRIALYQPDIPQNFGNLLRLCACLGVACEAIEPFGFPFDDKRAKRAGMDYIDQAALTRHPSWAAFRAARPERLVLLSSKAEISYLDFAFNPGDMLLLGQESAGVPDSIAAACDAMIRILMQSAVRCLNVTSAAAMVAGEALRQAHAAPNLIKGRKNAVICDSHQR